VKCGTGTDTGVCVKLKTTCVCRCARHENAFRTGLLLSVGKCSNRSFTRSGMSASLVGEWGRSRCLLCCYGIIIAVRCSAGPWLLVCLLGSCWLASRLLVAFSPRHAQMHSNATAGTTDLYCRCSGYGSNYSL
jgi:hypothetical protein